MEHAGAGQGTGPRTLIFTVLGEPVGKERPRARGFMVAGKIITSMYTPKKTKDYERHVAMLCVEAVARQGWTYTDDDRFALEVLVLRTYVNKGADADNYVKAIGDAINKIAYPDDRLVRRVVVTVTDDRDNPRTVVTVSKV
jgi:Holliday junction resolvase RusA-like endonuclease